MAFTREYKEILGYWRARSGLPGQTEAHWSSFPLIQQPVASGTRKLLEALEVLPKLSCAAEFTRDGVVGGEGVI